MDKYEYKLRADEIKSLIGQGRYQEAADLADTIDWRRVKSISMLGTISDLYKINRRYEESKNVLLMAYDRFPEGRSVVYSLCELAIKTGEIVQAIEYYKEFVRVAPRDTARYILQYKLYEAQEVGIEERIAVLEELKKHDYRDKWAYELALLYHRAGLKERCVDECDQIAMHFEMSRYVARALELKQLHTPLSETQETRLAIFRKEHPEHAAVTAERLGIAAEQKMNLTAMEQDAAQVHRGNTQEITGGNLEEALRSSRPVSEEEALPEKETQYAPLEMPEEIPPAPAPEPEPAPEEVPAGQTQIFAPVSPEPVFEESAVPQQEVGVSFNTMNLQEALADNIKEVLEEPPAQAPRGPVLPHMTGNTRPIPFAQPPQYAEDMMDTAATRLFNDAEMAQIQAAAAGAPVRPIPEPKKQKPAPAPEPMPFMEVKPGMVVKPMRRQKPNHFEQMLTEGADGQISLFVDENKPVETQITGQLSIQDVLQQWEDSKKRQQENQMAQVRQRVADETGDMFERFDAEVKGGLHAQLESAVNDAIRRDKYARATGRDKDEDAYADLDRTTREIIMAHSGRTGDMQIYDLEDALEAEEKKHGGRDVEIDHIPDAIEPGDLAEAIEKRHAQAEDGWASTEPEEDVEEIDETPEIDSSLSGMEKVIAAAEAAAAAAGVDDEEDAIREVEVESLYVEEAPIEEEPEEETPWEEAAMEAAAEREAEVEEVEEEDDEAEVEEVEIDEAEVEEVEAEAEEVETDDPDEVEEDTESDTEEAAPTRSVEELRATAPWRMLEEEEAQDEVDAEEEAPHQSATLTASPQGEAQEEIESHDDDPAKEGEAQDESDTEEVAETEEMDDLPLEGKVAAEQPDEVEDVEEDETEDADDDEADEEEVEETDEDAAPELTGMARVIAAAEAAAAAQEKDDAQDEAAAEEEIIETEIHPEEDAEELREEITEEITGDLEELENMVDDTPEEGYLADAEPGATTADIPGISAELESLLDELEPTKTAEDPADETSMQEEVSEEPTQEAENESENENEEDDFVIASPPDVGAEEQAESIWRSQEEGEAQEETESHDDDPIQEGEAQEAPDEVEEIADTQEEKPPEEETLKPEEQDVVKRPGREDDDPADKEMEARVRAMTQEEKVLFGPYIMQKSARRQIINAIDNMSMEADTGNAIVTGEEGAGSLSLAKGLIRSIQLSDSNFSGKVAKISGAALNNKDIPSIFEQLTDGALIVHKAGDMSEETASSLRKTLKNESKGLIVILEDTKKAMNRLLKDNDSLNESFSVRVDIEPLDDDALISYAKKYAEKRGYMIDEFGILALHTVIDDLQTIDHSVTLAEVKEIVDKAILHADKKDAGYFFDVLLRKRYSDEDMVVLHEKDFMANR